MLLCKKNLLFLHNFSAHFCSGPSPVPLSGEYCLVCGSRGIVIHPEAALLSMFLQVVNSMKMSGTSLQKRCDDDSSFFVFFPPTTNLMPSAESCALKGYMVINISEWTDSGLKKANRKVNGWSQTATAWREVRLLNCIDARAGRNEAESPRPLAGDEDEDPSDGDEAVLEGVHGQDGELGSVLQRKDGEEPPAPGRAFGNRLEGEQNQTQTPLNAGDAPIRFHYRYRRSSIGRFDTENRCWTDFKSFLLKTPT